MSGRIKSFDRRNLSIGKGGWYVDIQIKGRRYCQFAGRTEAEARAFRDKLKVWGRDKALGLPAQRPEAEAPTFDALAADYLSLYAKHKRSYERDVRSVDRLKEFFSGRSLGDINAEAVARYRAKRAGISVATCNRELACLRTMLYKGVEWGRIPAYPLPTKKLLGREPEFKPRILDAEETLRLADAADPRWLRPAVIVWLNTGLRKCELLKLRREDVDLEEGTLTVIAENAKNGHARTMQINGLVVEALAAVAGETFFFESRKGVHLGPSTLNGPFKKAVEDAGIKGRVRIHDLRDTFATQALRAGVDIRTVAELIGDSPEVALKRYCHTDERTKRQAVERIAELGLGSRGKVREGSPEIPASASETVN